MGNFGGRLPRPAHVPEGTAAGQVLLPVWCFGSAGLIGNQSTKQVLRRLSSNRAAIRAALAPGRDPALEGGLAGTGAGGQLGRKVRRSGEGLLGSNRPAVRSDTERPETVPKGGTIDPALGRTMSVRRPRFCASQREGGTPLWGLVSALKRLPSRIPRAQRAWGRGPHREVIARRTLRLVWRPFSRLSGGLFRSLLRDPSLGHELPRTPRNPEFLAAGSSGSEDPWQVGGNARPFSCAQGRLHRQRPSVRGPLGCHGPLQPGRLRGERGPGRARLSLQPASRAPALAPARPPLPPRARPCPVTAAGRTRQARCVRM